MKAAWINTHCGLITYEPIQIQIATAKSDRITLRQPPQFRIVIPVPRVEIPRRRIPPQSLELVVPVVIADRPHRRVVCRIHRPDAIRIVHIPLHRPAAIHNRRHIPVRILLHPQSLVQAAVVVGVAVP